MKELCTRCREMMCEETLLPADLAEHVKNCPGCAAFAASLKQVDAALAALPESDAPEQVVREVVAQAAAANAAVPARAAGAHWPYLPVAFAVSLLFGIWLMDRGWYGMLQLLTYFEGTFAVVLMIGSIACALVATYRLRFKMAGGFAALALCCVVLRAGTQTFFNSEAVYTFSVEENSPRIAEEKKVGAPEESEGAHKLGIHGSPQDKETVEDLIAAFRGDVNTLRSDVGEMKNAREMGQKEKEEANAQMAERLKTVLTRLEEKQGADKVWEKDQKINKPVEGAISFGSPRKIDEITRHLTEPGEAAGTVEAAKGKERLVEGRVSNLAPELMVPSGREGKAVFSRSFKVPLGAFSPQAAGNSGGAHAQASFNHKDTASSSLLADRTMVDHLTFQSPTGYWANTYVPGDSELRRLAAKVGPQERKRLQALLSGTALLDEGAHTPAQPFDAPSNSALAVFLNADRSYTAGKSRVLLQVGLKGTKQRTGVRPAIKAAVVLDIDPRSPEADKNAARELLFSLARAKQPGDEFSLYSVSKQGVTVTPPKDFRRGALAIGLKELFAAKDESQGGRAATAKALQQASYALQGSDAAALNSNLILLVTNRSYGAIGSELASEAHKSALFGVPVSTVAVGERINPAELDEITIAGQGNRRTLAQVSDADTLVSRELSASARVVARAVRLNIKLAAGVQLVDVLGSHKLGRVDTARVKAAEEKLDLRISKALGIESDRGQDDDGVQIIIPAFYADDAYIILLDVVTAGPGPLAEVSTRFKDLAFVNNGAARAGLALPARETPLSPLEINVTKNYLAYRLAQVLRRAGEEVSAARMQEALVLAANYRKLLGALRGENAALAGDADIKKDLSMLEEYISLLAKAPTLDLTAREQLADSLRLAGKKKVLTVQQEL